MSTVDLTSLMGDAEPTTVKVGDRVYTADPEASTVLVERVTTWCDQLLAADEDEADKSSIELVSLAYQISHEEAAQMKPRLRRSMLNFFVRGPLLPLLVAQP